MSVPRLSFREPPLRIKVRKKPIKAQPAPGTDIESQQTKPPVHSNYRVLYFICAVTFLVFMRIFGMYLFKNSRHTIKKLKCNLKNRIISCYGANPVGTFVIEVPSSCSGSIYDVGGYPFSIAEHDKYFKVPAKDLSVKDINGKCEAKAYVDSNVMELTYPFTWVTTNQHTTFTLLDGNEVIVDKVSADLFKSVTRGPWIAYTYDIPGSSATVLGDGTDIIHVYNGVSG